jgi:hypothetical protein
LSKESFILCGGVATPAGVSETDAVRLNFDGPNANAQLKLENISKAMVANLPPELIDLLEIAAYVYCGDQATTRGGNSVKDFGATWRRKFRFHIPVRKLALWSSEEVQTALRETIGFLSDDEYEFQFYQSKRPPPLTNYMDFGPGGGTGIKPEEVVLFSGGLDSLGGAVQEALVAKRKIVLVSHRSSSKTAKLQSDLMDDLERKSSNRPFHIKVWCNKDKDLGREYTQRTRSFLYASLAAVVARLFGLWRIRFYENGVVSINLPISAQVIGSRATRTTHPQVLNGFSAIFSAVFGKPFEVENPFRWKTKAEVVKFIRDNGCGEMVKHTMSCTHVWEKTNMHSHCGICSQCIDRRFATLAAGCSNAEDPKEMYKVDLLTGDRPVGDSRTMLESDTRTAKRVKDMSETTFFSEFGEVSRVIRSVRGMPPDEVAANVLGIYKRHAQEVADVITSGFRSHAQDLSDGTLPDSSLLILALPDGYKKPQADAKESGKLQAIPPIVCSYGELKRDKETWNRYFNHAATLDNNGKVLWVETSVEAHWQDKQKAEIIGMHVTSYSTIANKLFPRRPNRRKRK